MDIEKVEELDFEDVLIMKEKRRTSRSKGKKTYERTKIKSSKPKQRNVKRVNYDPSYEEDYYDNYYG